MQFNIFRNFWPNKSGIPEQDFINFILDIFKEIH